MLSKNKLLQKMVLSGEEIAEAIAFRAISKSNRNKYTLPLTEDETVQIGVSILTEGKPFPNWTALVEIRECKKKKRTR